MSRKAVLYVIVAVLAIGAIAITMNLTAQERGTGRRGQFTRDRADALFESSPLPKDEAEKKILLVLDDMRQN